MPFKIALSLLVAWLIGDLVCTALANSCMFSCSSAWRC
jgi:hypothetical protein